MFDGQVVRLEKLADVANKFIRVRLVRITGVDLNLFQFDYDLTWAAFFLNAEGKIYGRYGARDAKGPDERNTLEGLNYALQKALAAHEADPQAKPALSKQPMLAEKYPAAKQFKGGCIHCHQVHEFQRDYLKKKGEWDPEWRWMYPLPENTGITLDKNKGDLVKAIQENSPAAKAGLQPGDTLVSLNNVPVASVADVQFGLHQAPRKGSIPIVWKRGQEKIQAQLELPPDWRKTNTTWRPSLLDVLPSVPLYGEDLTAEEKKALKLPEKQLAFRQDKIVAFAAREAGVKAGDIIIGVNDLKLEMDMIQFLGYVRQTYLVGDQLTINVIRDGKQLKIPIKLTF